MTCWARGLGGCSTKLSREHYVTAALFGDDARVTVQGFPWCKEAPKEIGLASATAKILCRKHNSDLSPVDVAGLAGFQGLAEFHRLHGVRVALAQRRWAVRRRTLDGFGLERWFAKTAVNLAVLHPTMLRWPSGAGIDEPPVEHLRAVFGVGPFEAPAGLYMVGATGGHVQAARTVTFAPLLRGSTFCGGIFGFYGHRFVLSFLAEPLPSDLGGFVFEYWPHAKLGHRMRAFRCEIAGALSHELVFDWRST